jgi:hypothetical protein
VYLTILLVAIAGQGFYAYFPTQSFAAGKILDVLENQFGVAELFDGELCGTLDQYIIKHRFHLRYVHLWDNGKLETDFQLHTKIYNSAGDLVANIPEVSKKIEAEGGLPYTMQVENAIDCIGKDVKNIDREVSALTEITWGKSGRITEITFSPTD